MTNALLQFPQQLTKSDSSPNAWRKFEFGAHKTPKALVNALYEKKCFIDERLRGVMKDPGFPVTTITEKVPFCRMSLAEIMGLKPDEKVHYPDILESSKDVGDICPWETGPYGREQYLDQPEDDSVYIIMAPFRDLNGEDSIFHLGNCGGKLCLLSVSVRSIFRGKDEFLFQPRRELVLN